MNPNTARLIAISKPVIAECDTPGDLLAYCARVSNPENQASKETAPRLLKYLVRNSHWSPFEMASMTVEIFTTRDIARQILRHRSFSFQEFSQRYADASLLGELVGREARLQDAKNRQNSIACDDKPGLQRWWSETQEGVGTVAVQAYEEALKNGIAKEQARALLPEGLTPSRIYMAGTVRSFIHYCEIRCDAATQKEHRDVAESVKSILIEQFPALKEVLDT